MSLYGCSGPPDLKCHDCGVGPGELHESGCDTERCRLCGYQAISCDCWRILSDAAFDAAVETEGGRLPWTGEFPGSSDARELGFWSYWDDERERWVQCDENAPGAGPDLNRLNELHCRWDREAGKWVK